MLFTMRYLLLCLLGGFCLGCTEKEEFTQALPDNDFIEGNFDGRDFRLVQGSYLAGLETHFVAEEAVNGDATAPERRYLVRRIDTDMTYQVELNLPLDLLKHGASLPARVSGTLTWSDLFSDSYPGCPHIDEGSADALPVSLQLDGWVDNALTGSYVSTDAARDGSGQFSLVIAQP